MRRLWLSLLLVPVMVAAVALPISGAAWASPAAPGARSAPAARTAPAAALLISGRALQPGTKGSAVKALQRRLAALKYYPGAIDGRFGTSTLEAVWAFYEAQGLTVHSYVNSAMKWRLAHPRAPKVLVSHGGANRIEVSLTREILVLYRNNQVQLISHVSTGGHYHYCSPGGGCGYAVTPTGNYHTVVFMRGWVHVPLGEMFNPVFFIGTAFAIHGDTDVPLAPVSHGCVRIPMDIANFFHKLVKVPGERVYIR
jgi:Putative peptidoglycan binding domain/L,D-transpeptidase catalytic domain